MTASPIRIEPLGSQHNRAAFSCGSEELDRYFQHQASQDMRRKVAAAFVLSAGGSDVIGYYTLSATSIEPVGLPADFARRMPRYSSLPAILLGRLVVDQRYRGQRFGEALLLDALRRAFTQSSQIAAIAVVVDAIDDAAVRFYERYDFQRLADEPPRLFIPMATIALLIERAGSA